MFSSRFTFQPTAEGFLEVISFLATQENEEPFRSLRLQHKMYMHRCDAEYACALANVNLVSEKGLTDKPYRRGITYGSYFDYELQKAKKAVRK